MFHFKLEPEIPLLTITLTGFWFSATVIAYEAALRLELARLSLSGESTSVIVDARATGPHARKVLDALHSVVKKLGPLHADRTAVVTATGVAKLQAKRVADPNAQIFTSVALARDWVMRERSPALAAIIVHDNASEASAEGPSVHVLGPSDVDVTLTPTAALETAKRIGNAAVEVLLSSANAAPTLRKTAR